jgi:hypothetical protein
LEINRPGEFSRFAVEFELAIIVEPEADGSLTGLEAIGVGIIPCIDDQSGCGRIVPTKISLNGSDGQRWEGEPRVGRPTVIRADGLATGVISARSGGGNTDGRRITIESPSCRRVADGLTLEIERKGPGVGG